MVTFRQKIGQMLMMGFDGTELTEQSAVKTWLTRDGLGGVILFDYDMLRQIQGKNLKDKAQIKQLTSQLKAHSNSDLPLLIAIDYEGGAVDRLRHVPDCKTTMSPAALAKLPPESLQAELNTMAATLQELGFNLNFAPLVDLNLNETAGIIGKLQRSFSADPHEVARLAQQFVDSFAHYHLGCCYKHFPGHGSAVGDTHQGFVDVTTTFFSDELEPYRLLLSKKRSQPVMVMTAHVINRHLDPSGLPATLSQAILTGLLRQELEFNGVIISDDLQMHAISQHYTLDEALGLTINAGADMLIFANQLGCIGATELIDKIEQLVLRGVIKERRIEEAYQRICAFKLQLRSLA